MSTSIIAPIGTSPPVATELLEYLMEREELRVDALVLLITKDETVRASASIIKAAVADRYPKIKVRIKEVPFKDIDSSQANLEFLRFAGRVFRDETNKYNVERMFVNLAGGRKDMVVDLAIISHFYSVEAMYHVVMPEVKAFSEMLERIREDIKRLHRSENLLKYYQEHRDKFQPVMYPDPTSYNIIKIPIFPFPRFVLYRLGALRRHKPTRYKEVGLPKEYLERLKKYGIISRVGENLYLTDLGAALLEVFLH